MAAFRARILDVVVDQAEVVAHLHGGGTRQRALVLTRDRLVGQQAQQRSKALASTRPGIQAQVEPDPVVELRRALVLGRRDDARHLGLGIGDEDVEVRGGQHRNMIPGVSKLMDAIPAGWRAGTGSPSRRGSGHRQRGTRP